MIIRLFACFSRERKKEQTNKSPIIQFLQEKFRFQKYRKRNKVWSRFELETVGF